MSCKKETKGQVWVETAIYTLIGLTIIAILLAIANPQIQKIKTKSIISQTTSVLSNLDKEISEISESAPGNSRVVPISLGKGKININSENDSIIYVLEDTNLEYSEPGIDVDEGKLTIRTEEYGSGFNVFLILDYKNKINISYKGAENSYILQAGTTPYKLVIQHIETENINANPNIDFDLI